MEGSSDQGRATEPYARPQTERDKAHNRRQGRAEERKSDVRRGRPSIPEQQMIGLLAVLGERYISHVDFAWPQYHRILEFYGGPHYKPELDRRGTRHEDDARRIATLESVGWHVLIVFDFEISRDAWPTVIEKVERFLRQGSIREQEDGL